MPKIHWTHEMANDLIREAMTPKPAMQSPVNPALDVLKTAMNSGDSTLDAFRDRSTLFPPPKFPLSGQA